MGIYWPVSYGKCPLYLQCTYKSQEEGFPVQKLMEQLQPLVRETKCPTLLLSNKNVTALLVGISVYLKSSQQVSQNKCKIEDTKRTNPKIPIKKMSEQGICIRTNTESRDKRKEEQNKNKKTKTSQRIMSHKRTKQRTIWDGCAQNMFT